MSTPGWAGQVRILASNPGLAQRLADAHVDGGTGRCQVCRDRDGRPTAWPCTIAALAGAALEMRTRCRA